MDPTSFIYQIKTNHPQLYHVVYDTIRILQPTKIRVQKVKEDWNEKKPIINKN